MSREGRIGKKTNFEDAPQFLVFILFHLVLIHSILNETLTCIYHLKNTFHFDCAMTTMVVVEGCFEWKRESESSLISFDLISVSCFAYL